MEIKKKFDRWILNERLLGERPPPPPLPKYDPSEEAPKWNWRRIFDGEPVDKGPKLWTAIGTQPKSPDDPDWRGVIRSNVIEYPMPKPYNFGLYNNPNYFWFDTPDYADPFKKLWYSFKWFFYTGLFGAALAGTCKGRKFTLANHLHLLGSIVAPWVGAGMAGSTTVITLANLRGKKDDNWNYFAGGIVASFILGRKSHLDWFQWIIICPILAVTFKQNAETNGQLIPAVNLRAQGNSLQANNAEHGIGSGDLRWGIRGGWGDSGRDVRRNF